MSRSTARTTTAAALFAWLGAQSTAFAQALPIRLGMEFQINTETFDSQTTNSGSVAVESNGDFVVVYGDSAQDGSGDGAFGQRFASSGAKIGGEFQISVYSLGSQTLPVVGIDADGDFVVTFAGTDGGGTGIVARRFDSSGAALGADFQVNLVTLNNQFSPAVARDADGDFVIAWSSEVQDGADSGVFARRFNAAGAPQAAEFQVNSYTTASQFTPVIDLDQDGDFVVVWQSFGQDTSSLGVFAQRFNSLGARQGPEFQVNFLQVLGNQRVGAVGVDQDGDFVVAWQSDTMGPSGTDIFARRFDRNGTPLGAELQVNVHDDLTQAFPSLAIDADGDFVVAWQSSAQDGSNYGVFARHFKASGVPIGGDIPVNTTVFADQHTPAVGSDADGDFVVAWSSLGQDGDDLGVFGQRFDVPALLDIDGNGQLTALTDGLLVLRFFFGFTGTTLTSGAVGPNCMRCDSATILPYLQSLT